MRLSEMAAITLFAGAVNLAWVLLLSVPFYFTWNYVFGSTWPMAFFQCQGCFVMLFLVKSAWTGIKLTVRGE